MSDDQLGGRFGQGHRNPGPGIERLMFCAPSLGASGAYEVSGDLRALRFAVLLLDKPRIGVHDRLIVAEVERIADPELWPRSPGSWPGYVFTGEPLKLAAGHYGLGHGARAHAPDEYYVIESASPKFLGYDGAVKNFVDYFFELAAS